MFDKNGQSAVVKSQASLDQAWAGIEGMLPRIVNIAEQGIGSVDDLEIALACVRLVGWEVSLRIVQREQFVRCVVLPEMGDALPGEVAVRITTTAGQQTYYVPESSVVIIESKSDDKAVLAKIEIKAYPVQPGIFAIELPTIHKNTVIVPTSEVIFP
jgi:hypothetical protein